MKSDRLKMEALCWLRYTKRYELLCTEVQVGHGIADVYAIGPDWQNPTNTIEIETKISAGDLRRDFEDKSAKHFAFRESTKFTPNYFYFLVPEDLKDLALSLCNEHNKKYGVLVVGDGEFKWNKKVTFECLQVVQKASKLHKEPPHASIVRNAILRMGSEMCLLHKKTCKKEINETNTD